MQCKYKIHKLHRRYLLKRHGLVCRGIMTLSWCVWRVCWFLRNSLDLMCWNVSGYKQAFCILLIRSVKGFPVHSPHDSHWSSLVRSHHGSVLASKFRISPVHNRKQFCLHTLCMLDYVFKTFYIKKCAIKMGWIRFAMDSWQPWPLICSH